jgi:hypothetical protein
MKPLQYVTSMCPKLEKGQLEKEIKQIRTDLLENTLPSYQSAAEWLESYKLQSPEAKKFQELFGRGVRTSFRGDFITVIFQSLKRAGEHLDKLEGLINRTFASDVMRDGMTFSKTATLQHLEAISFAVLYSNRLLLWVYTAEAEAMSARNRMKDIVPAEVNWLNSHREDFFNVIQLFVKTAKEVEETIEAMPNIVVNEDSVGMVTEARGARGTDPFAMGFVKNVLNPFLFIGKMIAEWQVERYNASKEYKAALELKLLHLKKLRTGTEDAALEQKIEYHEREISNAHRKIAKWEAEHA